MERSVDASLVESRRATNRPLDLVAMCLGAALVLSGCGDETATTPAPAPAPPPPPAPEPEPEPEPEAPTLPTGLMVSATTEMSITWSWNPVEGATAYVVQASANEMFGDADDQVHFSLIPTFTAEVPPETTVYLRVAAAIGTSVENAILSEWTTHVTGMSNAPTPPEPPAPPDPFARWNTLPPEPWWRDSEPYTCVEEENPNSPWTAAGLPDLGGADPLSLIRYFGNETYIRYSNMGFTGCTPMAKYPDRYHLDAPIDPTYYSRGDLEIHVDIARVPPDASGWSRDDGTRVDFSLSRAVALLNEHVVPYYRRISENQLRITFRAGEEFEVSGDGSPSAAQLDHFRLAGACPVECFPGLPGGLNRILLNDVAAHDGGQGANGVASFGLTSFVKRDMGTIVHEIGHAWMEWPHSFTEVPDRVLSGELQRPNPYSNSYDIMSSSFLTNVHVWDAGMPSTLAINRYAAGWIRPEDVALHLEESGTYTLAPPRRRGNQFLVVHSGRQRAFTTLEVLEEFGAAWRISGNTVRDGNGYRPLRYDGVLVVRYDQTAGTGAQARVGPALYNKDNPDFLKDVARGLDDYSLIEDGGSRDIGDGVIVTVSRNRDGSYEVTVDGGRTAPFERWCYPIWFTGEYDTGCFLDTAVWE